MNTKVFYDVPETAWLFQNAAKERGTNDKKWTSHEEAVRQWCIQELIRSYGVRVDCIEIERPVKVARERKANRADVVVLRDGRPYVVVECKAKHIQKLDDAIQQAMNYAVLPDMQATFAVATNGSQWIVRRRVHEDWIPLADVSLFSLECGNREWQHIHKAAQDLNPILFWLDRTVPAKHAARYFFALQRFFYGRNEITAASDPNLLWAADNLLRVLCSIEKPSGYTEGKMAESFKGLNNYWTSHGGSSGFGRETLWDMVDYGYAELSTLVGNTASPASLETRLLRVILGLLGYLRMLSRSTKIEYTDIAEPIQPELRSYINLALVIRFDAALPDPLDKISINDIRSMGELSWNETAEQRYGFLALMALI